MKHLNYIYIIILLVLVAACSKDDEGILDDGSHSQGEGQTSSSLLHAATRTSKMIIYI